MDVRRFRTWPWLRFTCAKYTVPGVKIQQCFLTLERDSVSERPLWHWPPKIYISDQGGWQSIYKWEPFINRLRQFNNIHRYFTVTVRGLNQFSVKINAENVPCANPESSEVSENSMQNVCTIDVNQWRVRRIQITHLTPVSTMISIRGDGIFMRNYRSVQGFFPDFNKDIEPVVIARWIIFLRIRTACELKIDFLFGGGGV